MIDPEELANRFTHHPPQEGQPEVYELIRKIAFAYAVNINELVPDGREKTLALTKLEQVVFWSNAGIARARN